MGTKPVCGPYSLLPPHFCVKQSKEQGIAASLAYKKGLHKTVQSLSFLHVSNVTLRAISSSSRKRFALRASSAGAFAPRTKRAKQHRLLFFDLSLSYDLLSDFVRCRFIANVLHREPAASLSHRLKIRSILEHLSRRNLSIDY